MRGPERTIIYIGAGVLALIVVSVAVSLALSSAEPAHFPPDSPAGVLQRYLDAVHDGDVERATSFLSAAALRQMGGPSGGLAAPSFCGQADEQRVRVRDADDGDDRATLTLEIEQFSGSALDVDRYSYERQVAFIREGEPAAWKIDEAWLCL